MLPLDVNVSDIDESSNITAKPKNNSQQTHYGGGEGGRRRGERERETEVCTLIMLLDDPLPWGDSNSKIEEFKK